MKIYIVKASSGQFDYFIVYNVKAFTSREQAQEWVNTRPTYDPVASQELEDLECEYIKDLEQPAGITSEFDKEWDVWEDQRYQLYLKALSEVQAKYPDADLTIDEDFNGYTVEELELEETE